MCRRYKRDLPTPGGYEAYRPMREGQPTRMAVTPVRKGGSAVVLPGNLHRFPVTVVSNSRFHRY
jgi:hypothetical protein